MSEDDAASDAQTPAPAVPVAGASASAPEPAPEVVAAPEPEVEVEAAPAPPEPPAVESAPEPASQPVPAPPAVQEAAETTSEVTSRSESPQPAPAAPAQSAQPVQPSIKDHLAEAFAALTGRTQKRLAKILVLARTKGRIKNDDVEKLLHVSDSSAARYLKQLVLEGKLFITKKENDAWYEPR